MTNLEKYQQASKKDFSQFLLNFFVGFNNESINGLCCGQPCCDCEDSCVGCISKWLDDKFSQDLTEKDFH